MICSFDFRRAALVLVILGVLAAVFFVMRPRPPTALPVEIPRSELTERDGYWYRAGEEAPFTGAMFETYETGERKARMEVANGRFEGLSERWYTNGQRQAVEHFRAGVSHGLRTKWHPNGRKLAEVQIVEGKLEGTFRRWYEDGTLFEEIQLANGKAEGVARGYYPSGYVRTEARLHEGELIGQKFWKDGEERGDALVSVAGQ